MKPVLLAALFSLSLLPTARSQDVGYWSSSAGVSQVWVPPSIVNVKAYGAKGDGIADDTAAVQRAVNSVPDSIGGAGSSSGGATIFWPPGAYKLTNTLVVGTASGFKNINMIGTGMLTTRLQWYGPATDPAIRVNGLKQHIWEGFLVENKVAKGTTVGVLVQRDSGTGTQSGGCLWRNVRVNGFAKGVQLGNVGITQATSEYHFDHLMLESNDVGLQIQDGNSLNFVFSMLELSANGTGLQVLSGGSALSVLGGATGYNTVAAFDFQPGASFLLAGIRSEHDDRFVLAGSTGAAREITLLNCDVTATANVDGYGVRVLSGPVTLIGNHFDTKVEVSGAANASATAISNTIVNTEIANFSALGGSGAHYTFRGNRQVDTSGVHVAHLSDEDGYVASGVRVPSWALLATGQIDLGDGTTDVKWKKALVTLGGGAAPTLGTIGGSGPTASAQNSWMRVLDSSGAAFWVPVWK